MTKIAKRRALSNVNRHNVQENNHAVSNAVLTTIAMVRTKNTALTAAKHAKFATLTETTIQGVTSGVRSLFAARMRTDRSNALVAVKTNSALIILAMPSQIRFGIFIRA